MKILKSGILVFFIALISACGGGGGGGGIAYEGLTTAVALDATNGETLATATLSNGVAGGDLGGGLLAAKDSGGLPMVVSLSRTLGGFAPAPQGISQATQSGSGPCGGSATITDNSTQTTINMSIVFNNYCDDTSGTTTVLNGGVSMSGTFDPFNVTMTFNNMSVNEGGETFAISGTMSMTDTEMTMNVVMSAQGVTYKFENIVMSVVEGLDYADVTLSGRFYHPDHGYVDISTPVALHYVTGDAYPSSGTLRLDGDAGSYVEIVALSNTQCEVTIFDGTTLVVNAVVKDWATLGA